MSAPETPQPEKTRRRGRRRRGRDGGDPPSRLYLLPHVVTTAGLFFGFYAIVQAFTGKPDMAALGIILAGVCDALDGRLARIARATSRFGAEYDSISDTVSFGVAPAMLAFSAGNLHVLGRAGWVMAKQHCRNLSIRVSRTMILVNTSGGYPGSTLRNTVAVPNTSRHP